MTLIEASASQTARYLTANGDAEVVAARPIQPRIVINLGTVGPGEEAVSGAVVTGGGEYVDVPNFDPAISHFINEWETHIQEPQVCSDGWWPANPVTVSTIDTPEGLVQRLIVIPGQFMRTSADGERMTGTERVWKTLKVKLFRKEVTNADTIAPTVRSVKLSNEGSDWTALVDAADGTSGIARIDVTQIGEETADFFSFTVGGPGPYSVTFPLAGVPGEEVSVMVTVHDGAGNVTTSTAKGMLVTPPPEGNAAINGGSPVTFSQLVALDSAVVHAVEMRMSIGGGPWSAWRPYAPKVMLTLPSVVGDTVVSVQYRNAQPTVLDISTSIRLAQPMVGGSPASHHDLVVRADDSLWAWGFNPSGQLGDGTTAERLAPVRVGTAADWLTVDPGEHHSLALKADGSLWAWGFNHLGQLGDGTTTQRLSPVQISGSWSAVSAGEVHSLGLKADGSLWAWGMNSYGQLGDGTNGHKNVPVEIDAGTRWTAISAGTYHSLGIRADGGLWAWGLNDNGELGDGSTASRNAPVRIGTDNDWVVVSAGTSFSLALKADGSLWSWGDNVYRQLGDGTMADHHDPVRVGGDNDWTTVSAGKYSGLALKGNGTLWAWGGNNTGQLGDGTTTMHDRPTRVLGGDEWTGVFAGAEHVLAVKADGSLWAWGSNVYGQLGDHTKNGASTPQPVLNFGVTTLAASAANGASGASVSEGLSGVFDVSENGRYVAFESDASNLVPGDTNACSDVFVLTVASGTIERVSVDSNGVEANGACVYPSISEDGRLISFTSRASNLAPGDTSTITDIFVHDRQTHDTRLVSVAYDGQHQLSNWSDWSSISADGRFVAFTSDARNMVAGDTNSTFDVFVRDLEGGTTQRASLAYDGGQASEPCSGPASISGDGRYVAFQAIGPLVADDTNGVTDVFVRDLAGDTSAIQRVSVTRDGQQSTGGSLLPAISDDGRYVTFVSGASLAPEDSNTASDVYVRGLETATLELMSVADDGSQPFGFSHHRPAISADGRYVAFTSNAALVLPDAVYTWDVFVRDRRSGVLERVSAAASGGNPDGESIGSAISSDGRYVAFTSVASDLVGGDINALRDVFIRRRW